MAKGYKAPHLCNHYCSHECPIGQVYVPEIKNKTLPEIVLETLAHLNTMQSKKDRLIEITFDGKIDNDEMDDFIYIQQELERISVMVETLQLWSEKMLADGAIDKDEYLKRMSQLKGDWVFTEKVKIKALNLLKTSFIVYQTLAIIITSW